ncbi:MAG: hypothetical protein ACR2NP_14210 [Pirellulaceae bacterium]
MNSTIEYIRRLNQSSVALKDEWLSRLRTVDAGPNSAVATPEIILTRESSIKGFDEHEYETPVTVVSKPAQDEAGLPPVHETIAEHPAPVSLPETDEPVEITNDTTPDSSESAIYADATNASVVMEVHAASIQPSTDSSDLASTTNSQREEIHQEFTSFPEQAPVTGTSQVLENTGNHDDIVRPAIMPLRPEQEAEVLPGQSDTEQHEPIIEITTSSIEDVIQRLEGTSGEASYCELEAAETGTSGDTVDFDHDNDTYVDDGESLSAAAGDPTNCVPAAMASYPTDRLGQRYIYAQSKKQKLIDSVVDQIASRFPPTTGATIMLVGTGREIDVDSAVSRVATCMAMRDMGNILLVDGNLPSRQMSSVLGLNQQAGVSELIRQQDDLSTLLCATDNSSLMILPAGRDQLTGTDVDLTAAGLSNKSFKQNFEYTIIGGARAGDSLTDAWAALVDGVYLLVDVDESDREKSKEVVDYFRNMGARIVGCIATRS